MPRTPAIGDAVEVLSYVREGIVMHEKWELAIIQRVELPNKFYVKLGDQFKALPLSEKNRMWR
jgi:hypothetical protein